jgi:hypothetical protein
MEGWKIKDINESVRWVYWTEENNDPDESASQQVSWQCVWSSFSNA